MGFEPTIYSNQKKITRFSKQFTIYHKFQKTYSTPKHAKADDHEYFTHQLQNKKMKQEVLQTSNMTLWSVYIFGDY